MRLRWPFLPVPCRLVLLVMAGVGSAWAQAPKEEEIPEPFRSFIPEAQKHMAEFPVLPAGTTVGKHELFTVRIDEKPIVVGGQRFGCVRFVAPPEPARDMVWAFSLPANWAQWYILPASGTMTGFRNWLNADRLYEELPATVDNAARLQTLAAESFKPGATYILWFKEQDAVPGPAMLSGAIDFLPAPGEKKEWDAEAIEKGLGLKTAPMADQVAYLKSRGGRALLDRRFFDPDYAEGRIEDLLYARRHSLTLADGWYIKTTIIIPVCHTEPLLADVQAAYGEADLVLSGKERQMFDKEPPKDEAAYYYDHVVFLVKKKAGQPRILRVSSEAADTSAVRPRQDGLTWGDVPLPEIKLRVFYRDRKEIARVAFWGEADARVISGDFPVDTFRRASDDGESREELQYLGKGDWAYRSVYQNGQTETTATLRGHAYQGAWHDFFPDGKPRTEANYDKGQLEGALKQWRQDGESRELHYRAGKLVDEEGGKPQ